MKRIAAIFLALLMFNCPALGEKAQSAELRLSSFAGLMSGSTRARVCDSSPTPENALNDAASVRTLSTFRLTRMVEGGYDEFKITLNAGRYCVSVNEGPEKLFSAEAVDALLRVMDDFEIAAWDGFNASDYNIEDGECFWLNIALTDGTSVSAIGENAFPDNYSEAMEALWRVLTWNVGEENTMRLNIGGTEVPVTWEQNVSVEALKAMLPLEIPMSMYGGFEQVGPIGASLPRNDAQTTTQAGDIVLYSGNQIVIFYGSNSWAYTRLGHVELSQKEMAELLGNGDVTIGIMDGQR